MLRLLGKLENVVKFQKFCGLQWDDDVYDKKQNERMKPENKNGYTNGMYNIEEQEEPKEEVNKYSYNPFIHKLFQLGSELGNEMFYITFLPFVFWNIDDYIARRLIVLWVFNMYAGQGLKDILCWPRPDSPPVLRLEQIYESEYGMPSTHVIAGSIIPFGLVYFSYDRFQVLCFKLYNIVNIHPFVNF